MLKQHYSNFCELTSSVEEDVVCDVGVVVDEAAELLTAVVFGVDKVELWPFVLVSMG